MYLYFTIAIIGAIVGIALYKVYQTFFKTLGVLEVRHNSLTPDTDEYSLKLNGDDLYSEKHYTILRIKHINYTREINNDYNEEKKEV